MPGPGLGGRAAEPPPGDPGGDMTSPAAAPAPGCRGGWGGGRGRGRTPPGTCYRYQGDVVDNVDIIM